MATTAAPSNTHVVDPKRDRLVITASALGTVFEWYDFFLYGILAALLLVGAVSGEGRLYLARPSRTPLIRCSGS